MSKRSNRIKQFVRLDQVLSEYGYNVRVNGSEQQFACDLHGSGIETRPSARYYPSTQTWYCFACGKVRDVVSTVMEKEGLEYRQACRAIEKKYGLSEWNEYTVENPIDEIDTEYNEQEEVDWKTKTINKLTLLTKNKVICLKDSLKFWEAIDFLLFSKNEEKDYWIKIYKKIESVENEQRHL